ncbi:Uncharacterised protein [Lysinibacillus capsici]|uniref:Uncharacterized protein n=1 Tax=Lysinibacillus capsici TaxID=2115968 RepID=A0A2X1A6R7_9BACI|nr:hypothetical protein [Lysinibacillus capsici]SPU40693.1 Uncharacterised protein [Lysinibacillus capsici]
MINNLQLKNVLEQQLITSSKAAQMLGISKQRLLSVVKRNGIEPIHQSTQGNLFLRDDIVKIKNGTIEKSKKVPIIITKDALGRIDEVLNTLDEITQIFVYFDDFDATLDGIYLVSEMDLNDLKSLKSTRFIIRDINGNEAWFYNLNCGYSGEGPTATKLILEKLGIPIEQSIYVTDSNYDRVKYYKNEDGQFEVHKNRSDFTRRTECTSTLYYHKGKIVCLQEGKNYLSYMDDKAKFLYEYSSIVPNPKNIILFNNRESAIEHGYFTYDFLGNEIVYQVILCDPIGRELWLCPPVCDITPLKYQKNINQILKFCGLDVDYERNKQKYPKAIIDWLNIHPKQVPVELITNMCT